MLQTFTAWVNSHLRKRGHRVENVQTDFWYVLCECDNATR